MPAFVPEKRARVLAVVRALKAVGVRVRNWKSFVHEEKTPERSRIQDSEQRFAFGRDLQLLPQHHVEEVKGPVALFLVEVCGYLSQHLHTEGLFRKTGSLGRIRTLRSDLEKGQQIFGPLYEALLQPCDVASLLKQFLRELPEPLIALELQRALCQAQTLEQGAREKATLLLTLLLNPVQTRTLQYICTFLRDVALRCDENRMEVMSLALVMAPNLLSGSAQACRLTVHTEKQLDQQAAAIRTLILHAEHIGVVPACVLETSQALEQSESTSPAEGPVLSRRSRLSVYSNMSRQRGRSVSELFVDAFSKLRPGRTATGPPSSLDGSSGHLISKSPASQSPSTVKRKASEEAVPELDGSAKKRRSLHDLRADNQSFSSQSAVGSTENPSHLAVKMSTNEPLLTPHKWRTEKSSHHSLKQEEQLHLKRRSLQFFSLSTSPVQTLGVKWCEEPEEQDQSFSGGILEEKSSVLTSASTSSLKKIPFILIEEPGRVVVGSEVDDDPDLLNCSFVENLDHTLPDLAPKTTNNRQDFEGVVAGEDECWLLLEDGDPEVLVVNDDEQLETPEMTDEVQEEPNRRKSGSKKHPTPRRSMSMPEVVLDEGNIACPQEEVHQGRGFWSTSVSLPLRKKQKEARRRRCGTFHEARTQKCSADSRGWMRRNTTRFSVVERFRSFGALAALLRTPTTRLHRQGARRFSRSFSDGVREEQQAFLQLKQEEEPQMSLTPSPSSSEELNLLKSPRKPDKEGTVVSPELSKIQIIDLEKVFEQQCSLTDDLKFNTLNDQQRASFLPSADLIGNIPLDQQKVVFTSTDSVSTYQEQGSPLLCETTPPLYEATPTVPAVFQALDYLSFDGVFSISSVSETCSLSSDLSPPPAFQFCPLASRRSYRDSPYWPAHDARKSAWGPLPY